MPDAPLLTERNNRTLSTTLDSRTGVQTVRAVRTFDITGVADAASAKAYLNASDIDYDKPHPQDSRAVVTGIDQNENVVAGMYTYTVTYTSNSGSGVLLDPPTVKYDPYTYEEESDHDAEGVPYVNTAGFPFEGRFPEEKQGVIITYSRWEPTYNIQTHFNYAGFTNSGTFMVPGGTLATGQAKCLGIFQGELSTITVAVRVQYKFDCRKEGWKKNVVDQGALGWGKPPIDVEPSGDPVVGEFVGGPDGSPVGNIRLDGDGAPINDSFLVSTPTYVGLETTIPDIPSPSAALVNSDLSTDDITILSFARTKSKVFNLNL